eukprot:TRINITY_DN48205_c0_g1_i1.p1 TRINITY_DN48205_c0_g1~~TRINITY_DN48205_c0_g1_i1.p1  ORF type:complete len:258 (-),score=39.51 TRINITY_DN48205_c0_g1_i1:24-734(-)
MVSLWGGLRSIIIPSHTRVLSIANGLFGEGIAEMAQGLGAVVKQVKFEWNQVPGEKDWNEILRIAKEFKPNLITAVHCETPSGTLFKDMRRLGEIAHEVDALFYVDAVSSAFGAPLDIQNDCIDIGLIGTQKALSLPPDSGIITVSERAWKVVNGVKYQGYDALLPFQKALETKYFPYTMNWRAIAAINERCKDIKKIGLKTVWENHRIVASYCRQQIGRAVQQECRDRSRMPSSA